MPKKPKTPDNESDPIFDLKANDVTLAGIVSRRVSEAKGYWNKKYELDKIRKENVELYTSEYARKELRDERYEEIFNDNKLFTSIRTIVPFVTSNTTKPEIIPANNDSLSRQFGQDFEKILVQIFDEEHGRDKVKLCIQDLLKGQRVGILKVVYDEAADKIRIEYCQPDSHVIGKRGGLHDEPDMDQHTQETTIGQLVTDFSDRKEEIYKHFSIEKGVPSQLERVVTKTENWIFVDTEEGQKLGIIWMLGEKLVLGKMKDPNWLESGKNIIDEHTMPFVYFNFLNDGSGKIDETSFIEMAQYNQKNYDKRGATIAQNAAYAGIGVPVFGKGAVKAETASKVQFSPVQRIMLDTEDVTKSFTTWTAGQLPAFVFEDKADSRTAVLDIFGTNQVQGGQDSDNKTLGQDVIQRNQAEGRQQELIDCIDNGMVRLYQILAQFVYRYYDSEHFYNIIGDDGEFEHLVISQSKVAKNVGIKIKVKAGSSLPVDRSQKIAQAIKLMEHNKIGTLRLYKELGLEDPEEAYKEFLREQLMPAMDITDMNKDIYSREADEDLQLVIAGKKPESREDIDPDYLVHINEYLLTEKYEQLKANEQQRVSAFVADIIARAQRKELKMQLQQPIESLASVPTDPSGATMSPADAGGAPVPPTPGPVAAPAAEPMPVR